MDLAMMPDHPPDSGLPFVASALALVIVGACVVYAMMDFGVFVLAVFFAAAGCP